MIHVQKAYRTLNRKVQVRDSPPHVTSKTLTTQIKESIWKNTYYITRELRGFIIYNSLLLPLNLSPFKYLSIYVSVCLYVCIYRYYCYICVQIYMNIYTNKFNIPINGLEEENHMITSIGTESSFEDPTLIHYKRPDEPRKKGNSSQHHKGHIQQTCTQHYTKQRKP